ncbi:MULTISPECIES: ABC transporter substrate-binding protein [unclassified Chelatococcus]|uniref:ABC transporter substrate-binding protein n=1 Tax=unclassified Chelatococcus TaxID=2638111 RepID=UPI001BCEC752|nr:MULTISPECIES: ABC transporter substrate-binding protein [unclassified Chelatococcus]MBS7697338.1 ABC transporter substrate-binding protein [Chelatococcus sp. YT9]MBX3556365.1 ABC transporter substrate-binding protein [Chelatococcus sp.]
MKLLQTLATGLFAATVAFAPAMVRAQEKQEVRVAMLAPSALLWLHAIAKDQGFYAKHGIEVKELVAATSPALLQAVSSGSVEAGVAVADLAMRAIDQNAPIVISGAILGHSILRFVGGKGVESAKDLEGKPVTAGGVQGGTANLLRYLMIEAGVDGKGAKLVAMANSKDRIVAMQNGQVAGSLLIAPFDSMAQRDGMKVLGDYTQDYLQTPLILNKTWAASNRKAAVGLTQATRDAANWIYDPANKQKAIDILAAYTKVDPAICAESYAFIVEQQKAIGRGLEVTPDSLRNLLKISEAVGAAKESEKPFDLKNYYDPSFLAGN